MSIQSKDVTSNFLVALILSVFMIYKSANFFFPLYFSISNANTCLVGNINIISFGRLYNVVQMYSCKDISRIYFITSVLVIVDNYIHFSAN